MAFFSIDLKCDLHEPLELRYLDGNLFSGDSDSVVINVSIYDKGLPVGLGSSGWSVIGSVIKPNGQTIPSITGGFYSQEPNKAYLVIPGEACSIPGEIGIVIKATYETTITTIASVRVNVFQSETSNIISS